MNIEKLISGKTFKNYKELCTDLGMEVKKSSKSKKYQLRELERYCTYIKEGHSFKITEVFSDPRPKVDNRGKSEGSRRDVYGNLIQLLIADLLAQTKAGRISISRGRLLLAINMVNENYSYCGENVPKLSKYTDIEEAVIYDFLNTSNSNFKSTVETALKQLMDKRIIWYDRVTKVSKGNTRDTATQEDKEIIMKYETEVLKSFGYKSISQVRSSKHWKLFKKEVQKLLNKNSDIDYYYFAYDITVNKEGLKEERQELSDFLLEDMQRLEYHCKLNITVSDHLKENAKKRHDNHFTGSQKMNKYRREDQYIEKISKLIGYLVDLSASDIMKHIGNIELDEWWGLPPKQQEEFERLFD
jgi:hypothetical protein